MANHIFMNINKLVSYISEQLIQSRLEDMFNTILLQMNVWLCTISGIFHSLLDILYDVLTPETLARWVADKATLLSAAMNISETFSSISKQLMQSPKADLYNRFLLQKNVLQSAVSDNFHSLLAKFNEVRLPTDTLAHYWFAVADKVAPSFRNCCVFVLVLLLLFVLLFFGLPAIISCIASIAWLVVLFFNLISRCFVMLFWAVCSIFTMLFWVVWAVLSLIWAMCNVIIIPLLAVSIMYSLYYGPCACWFPGHQVAR